MSRHRHRFEGHQATDLFCRGCGYALRGLESRRCPECGRGFDPLDPASTRSRPRRRPRTAWRIILGGGLAAGVVYGGLLLWLVAGWRGEQRAIGRLRGLGASIKTQHIGGPLLAKVLPARLEYLLERAREVKIGWPDRLPYGQRLVLSQAAASDLASLSRLAAIRLCKVEVRGEDLSRLAQLKHLRELSIVWSVVVNPRTVGFRKMQGMEELDLADTEFGDEAVAEVCALRRLTSLRLSRTGATDAALGGIGNLTKLEVLELDETGVGDRTVSRVCGLAGLRKLDLYGCERVTDAAVPDIAALSELWYVGIGGTRITDARLPALCRLEHLEVLDLPEGAVADRGFCAVSRIKTLRVLRFIPSREWTGEEPRVSHVGLGYLKALPNLEYVRLGMARVSGRGLRDLQASRPSLEIHY